MYVKHILFSKDTYRYYKNGADAVTGTFHGQQIVTLVTLLQATLFVYIRLQEI